MKYNDQQEKFEDIKGVNPFDIFKLFLFVIVLSVM
jgi:hypothetical protein